MRPIMLMFINYDEDTTTNYRSEPKIGKLCRSKYAGNNPMHF